MNTDGRRFGSRTFATVALAVALVLAGCGGGQSTATPTNVDISAETVEEDVLASVENVDSYVTDQRLNMTISANNQEVEQTIRGTVRVDRASEEFVANQTVEGLGQTVQVDIYLKDGVLYQRSDQYVQQFSSEWIKQDLSENASTGFRSNDLLGNLQVILPNATLSVTGASRVDGTDVYVLEGPVNGSAIEDAALGSAGGALPGSLNVSNASVTVYAAQDSGRPLRVDQTADVAISLQGQSVDASIDSTAHLDYESVSVTLPEGAATAVNATETLQSDSGS